MVNLSTHIDILQSKIVEVMALPNFQPYFCAEQSFGKTKPLRTKTNLHYFPQPVFSNTSVQKFEKVPNVGQVSVPWMRDAHFAFIPIGLFSYSTYTEKITC